MLKFSKLHYEKNWFTALFSIMKKVIQDGKSGQPVLSFKQTWGNGIQIFSDPNFQTLMLEGRFLRKAAFEWELFEAGKEKPFGKMISHVFQTIAAFGAETVTLETPAGKPLILVEREGNAGLKHVLDNMTELYNPSHVYTLKKPSGAELGKILAKHGLFKSFYDFELTGGSEEEKAAALLVFAHFTLSLKR